MLRSPRERQDDNEDTPRNHKLMRKFTPPRKPLSEQYKDHPFWREWAYDIQCPYCGYKFTEPEYENHIPCPEDKGD